MPESSRDRGTQNPRLRQRKGKTPTRDYERLMIKLGAALSEIFLARRAFPLESFQFLPLGDCQNPNAIFDDIVGSDPNFNVLDPETGQLKPRPPKETVILRYGGEKGQKANNVLNYLSSDIFRLIEEDALVKLKVCFQGSRTWHRRCLREVYNVDFQYESDGSTGIEIQRGGLGDFSTWETEDGFSDFLQTLESLPVMTGRTRCSFFITRKITSKPPILSMSAQHKEDITPMFRLAEEYLTHHPKYHEKRISHINIEPLPAYDQQLLKQHGASLLDPIFLMPEMGIGPDEDSLVSSFISEILDEEPAQAEEPVDETVTLDKTISTTTWSKVTDESGKYSSQEGEFKTDQLLLISPAHTTPRKGPLLMASSPSFRSSSYHPESQETTRTNTTQSGIQDVLLGPMTSSPGGRSSSYHPDSQETTTTSTTKSGVQDLLLRAQSSSPGE